MAPKLCRCGAPVGAVCEPLLLIISGAPGIWSFLRRHRSADFLRDHQELRKEKMKGEKGLPPSRRDPTGMNARRFAIL
jgi:hypothetical protein